MWISNLPRSAKVPLLAIASLSVLYYVVRGVRRREKLVTVCSYLSLSLCLALFALREWFAGLNDYLSGAFTIGAFVVFVPVVWFGLRARPEGETAFDQRKLGKVAMTYFIATLIIVLMRVLTS